MRSVTEALIDAVMFIELSDSNAVRDDSAAFAVARIAQDLQGISESGIILLKEVLDRRIEQETAGAARPEVLAFYHQFLSSFHLLEEDRDTKPLEDT